MTLVFSLPFCLLLPDSDYPIKMDDGEVDIINLKKIIPKVYDERLPYRGFRKDELNNIKYLWINGKKIEAEDLPNYSEFGVVTKYIDKQEKEVIPQISGDEVSISEPDLLNKVAKSKLSKLGMMPKEGDAYSDGEHYHGRPLVVNAEVKKDSFGRFRYTKVYYKTSKVLNMKDAFVRAINAVNKLIDIYRVETSDFWITSVTENDIFIYKSVSDTDMHTGFSMKGFTRVKKDKEAETVELIKNHLLNPVPQHPFMMLILDAEKSINDGKYYLSVIYSIIALESLVKVYVLFYARIRGLGEKAENDLGSQGVYFLVNTILKIFVESSEFTEDIIKKVSEGIRLRNKIIHKSELDVSEQDARKVLGDVRTMARILSADIGKQYEKLEDSS